MSKITISKDKLGNSLNGKVFQKIKLSTDEPLDINSPIISLQYLAGNGGCFVNLLKKHRNNSNMKLKLEELQNFIRDFSDFKSLGDAFSTYSGKTRKIKKTNKLVGNAIKQLHKNYPKLTGIVAEELSHLHARRNGNGETVYFGFEFGNIFYIIYIDSTHDFDKK